MRDRVPTYPGRVTLTPVTGQDNTYDMQRADAPVSGYEGMPLNKANLLTDATAAAIGLDPDDNPSVNDALMATLPKVGDIKTTARTDLGDKWLLCNGDIVSSDDYPHLIPLLPTKDIGYKSISSGGSTICWRGVFYYNGKYLAVGSYETADGNYAMVAFMTSTESGWSYTQMSYAGMDAGGAYYMPKAVTYDTVNQKWIATGYRYGSSAYAFCSASSSGNVSTWFTYSFDAYYSFRAIASYNGTTIVVGGGSSVIYSYMSTNGGTTWTTTSLHNTNKSMGEASGICCNAGTWVISSGKNCTYPSILVATNPTGTWTKYQIDTTAATLTGISCYNGVYAAVGYTSSGVAQYVYSTTDPTGTWTRTAINADVATYFKSISVYKGKWIVVGNTVSNSYARVYIATDPTGTWVKATISDTESSIGLYSVTQTDDQWVATGTSSAYENSKRAHLPIITSDDSYAYIKALEG